MDPFCDSCSSVSPTPSPVVKESNMSTRNVLKNQVAIHWLIGRLSWTLCFLYWWDALPLILYSSIRFSWLGCWLVRSWDWLPWIFANERVRGWLKKSGFWICNSGVVKWVLNLHFFWHVFIYCSFNLNVCIIFLFNWKYLIACGHSGICATIGQSPITCFHVKFFVQIL